VLNPGASLATITTRLAINALQSAWVRRETYLGPWLPEPVDTTVGPYLGAERGEALEFTALVPDVELTIDAVNGRAGLALRDAGRAMAVVVVETADTGITARWTVLNPAKLHRWHSVRLVTG